MPRLVLDGLELQDHASGIWFDVVRGGLDDLAEWVGEDDEVLEASGREPGEWMPDVRPLVLFGHIWGVGATRAASRAAYRAKVDALMHRTTGKMRPSNLLTLVAHPPNEGLSSGQTATLSSLRPVGHKNGPIAGWEGARSFELILESIASPPEWVIAP